MILRKWYVAYQGSNDLKWFEEFHTFLVPLIKRAGLTLLERPRVGHFVRNGGWPRTFKEALSEAELIILMVNQKYFADVECQAELTAILSRVDDNQHPAKLVILPLGPATLDDAGLGNFPVLPHRDLSLVSLSEIERARVWKEVVDALKASYLSETGNGHRSGEDYACLYLKNMELIGFKCFDRLKLDFSPKEPLLGGRWHCIAGINGAGKSSILEAICLGMLGNPKAELVGDAVVGRKCRQGSQRTEIRLEFVDKLGSTMKIVLPLDPKGIHRSRSADTDEMRSVWSSIENMLFISLGSTRDFSENRKPVDRFSETLRRHLSLFDPLEPPVDDSDIFKGIVREDFLDLLSQLLTLLPSEFPIAVDSSAQKLSFKLDNTICPLLEVPSGLRSTIILFAALVREWCRIAPHLAKERRLDALQGVVLLDEIDLHLHPRLQRTIVPQLRKHLPGIQWVVTTHSPLVLSSFEMHELTWLKPDSSLQPSDRQILGFTPDQIYEHLMDTQPISVLKENYLKQCAGGQEIVDSLTPAQASQLFGGGFFAEMNEAQLQVQLEEWRSFVRKQKQGQA